MNVENLWHGFVKKEFVFEEREAIIVFPEHAGENRNWALKTEYWGAFPETEIELLKGGFHVAYLKNTSRFATKEDCDAKARFSEFLRNEYGLSKKCALVGMSLGGAHAMNFAGFHPDLVACVFLDAPVLNFSSLPGKYGDKVYEEIWEKEMVKAYPGITRAKLLNFDNHPINKADILIEHRIPIIMVYGTEDATVIYDENGRLLEDEYSEHKDLLKVIPRLYQGHHPHGLLDKSYEISEFIIEKCNNAAKQKS